MTALQATSSTSAETALGRYDAVVVGAGFAGMYMLHRLRGLGLSARVYEQGGDVGGTWYWNRYPGARCDVESMQYSYSFDEALQQEWNWSERYSAQPEILKYAQHVADRFKLRSDIQFETRVERAEFDEAASRWTIATSRGDKVSARYFILATGCLSNARIPDFPGLNDFKGKTYHTGHWPHQPVDFTGQRVGIIGTGSSGIQAVPVIAEQAEHLTVFQRTPNFSIPSRNGPLTEEEAQYWKTNYAELRRRMREEFRGGMITILPDRGALDDPDEARTRAYEDGWERGGVNFMAVYNNLIFDKPSNDTASDFVRNKIAAIVRDPETAKLLQPNNHPIGSKRICVDTDYYAAFNRENVHLVDVSSDPIERLTPDGLKTRSQSYQLDAIVFGTGFDAMTGSVAKIDIVGRGGMTLNAKWAEGPRTYLGLMSAGFPNMFIITGPGSPSVLANMVVAIEQHVDFIVDFVTAARARGADILEADKDAEDRWVAHVNDLAHQTLYPQANSWYMGANIPGKPQIFMPYIGGLPNYRRACDDVVAKGYEGFTMTSRRDAASVAAE